MDRLLAGKVEVATRLLERDGGIVPEGKAVIVAVLKDGLLTPVAWQATSCKTSIIIKR
jgi:hypothetical protein